MDNIAWRVSYLQDRKHLVTINPNAITCGVHQGSSLGPLLFYVVNEKAISVDPE